ncbi:MAG: hypothetical protein KC613_22915 [Myxococcales bacterium]|nr:hypothetical protein [Myxococcales bacterium]
MSDVDRTPQARLAAMAAGGALEGFHPDQIFVTSVADAPTALAYASARQFANALLDHFNLVKGCLFASAGPGDQDPSSAGGLIDLLAQGEPQTVFNPQGVTLLLGAFERFNRFQKDFAGADELQPDTPFAWRHALPRQVPMATLGLNSVWFGAQPGRPAMVGGDSLKAHVDRLAEARPPLVVGLAHRGPSAWHTYARATARRSRSSTIGCARSPSIRPPAPCWGPPRPTR